LIRRENSNASGSLTKLPILRFDDSEKEEKTEIFLVQPVSISYGFWDSMTLEKKRKQRCLNHFYGIFW